MCDAYGDSPDCDYGLGFGALGGSWDDPPVQALWGDSGEDFRRPTGCPACGAQVYLVRHCGGTVWFEELGPRWDGHACFADDGFAASVRRRLHGTGPADARSLLGVVIGSVRQSRVERFTIRCSDWTLVVHAAPPGALSLGQLVLARLRDDVVESVGAVTDHAPGAAD
jgi:hypothetical protein